MILTITMNPSLDYSYITESFAVGTTNRFPHSFLSIGGKGINAGRVAAQAGSEVLLTGFVGGETGKIIENTLRKENRLTLEFLHLDENSRNAITIMHDDDTHTEIVEKGPRISRQSEAKFRQHLRYLLKKYPRIGTICVCGSVNSENLNFYADLLDFLKASTKPGLPILMDISGRQLLGVLTGKKAKPAFVKPNIHELGEIFHTRFTDEKTIRAALRDPLFDGIETVMVSRGSDGALVKNGDSLLDVRIPTIEIVNTTGCGDATVGGTAHYMDTRHADTDRLTTETIKYAMACGMSNAGFNTNGMIDTGDVQRYLDKITVTDVKTTQAQQLSTETR